jgi:hypothetical protein
MRQAILLYDLRALVSVSPPPPELLPQQGSPLDSLGIGQTESKCRLK